MLRLPVAHRVGEREEDVVGEVVGDRLPEALTEGVTVPQEEGEVVED
jgi:hypothetical protein